MLYGGTTRAVLLYLDFHGLIQVRWSPLLLVETSRALSHTGRLTREAAALNEASMVAAAPDAAVTVAAVQRAFRAAWPGVRDAKDLHVAACALVVAQGRGSTVDAEVRLITKNTRDFAPRKLAALGIRQQHPDAFLFDVWTRDPDGMSDAFAMFRGDLPAGPPVERVLHKLASDGQRRTAAAMLTAHVEGSAVL